MWRVSRGRHKSRKLIGAIVMNLKIAFHHTHKKWWPLKNKGGWGAQIGIDV
ncbi:Uncharacterized protein APZ42_013162 [Daphnia magna]|uniref:Uncharacterized protein n=1 Tax=Daphnia magna TaxID=35525 RepID=A0A162R2G9_9CRUS|nr:Uncharacterized protein APZ42_013162 [Daphnia magna]